MARIEWVEFRLLNWARWKVGGGDGPLGYVSTRWQTSVDVSRGGYREVAIPTNAVEASETDSAVQRLRPPELVAAVASYYCGGGTYRDKVRALGCSVATMYSRIEQAHQQLSRMFAEQRRAADAERGRVERLQAETRPTGSLPPVPRRRSRTFTQ